MKLQWLRRLRHGLQDARGFTLLELMIVVVIIAILAAGGVVGYGAMVQRAVNGDAANFKATLQTAVRLYETEKGTSPGDLSSTALATELRNYADGLPTFEVATTAPTASSPAGYYVKCPAQNSNQWQVWSVRNGRVSQAQSFEGERQVSVNNGCGAGS